MLCGDGRGSQCCGHGSDCQCCVMEGCIAVLCASYGGHPPCYGDGRGRACCGHGSDCQCLVSGGDHPRAVLCAW